MELYIVEFDLKTRSPLTVERGDVIIDRGYSTITVRNVEAEYNDDASRKARIKGNALLDELCFQYGVNLEIGGGWTIMPQDSSTTRHIKTLTISSKISGGHRKRMPRLLEQVNIIASDAKTYYRKAKTANDPFETFRNLYLAIENVSSKIAIIKCRKYEERELLKAALHECFSSDSEVLEKYSHVSGFTNTGNIFFDVASFLYKNNRVQLNHSKARKDKKIPYNPDDEWQVEVSLTLVELVAKSLISYEETHLSGF